MYALTGIMYYTAQNTTAAFQRIPRHIYQIGLHPTEHTTTWRIANPEYSLTFLTDHDCDALVRAYNNADTARAYAAALVGVIRADLCRLIVISLRGGFYADTDVVPTAPLRLAVPGDATMFSTERYSFELFGAIPRHPFVVHALNSASRHILDEMERCTSTGQCCVGSHNCVIRLSGPISYFSSVVAISRAHGCTNRRWVPGRTQCADATTAVVRNIYKCKDTGLRNNPYRTTFCGIARHMDCRNSGRKQGCRANHYSKKEAFYNYSMFSRERARLDL